MQRLLLFYFFFLLFASGGLGQNLLPDGQFRERISNDCGTPLDNFFNLEYWYTVHGTPAYFQSGCPVPQYAWNYWQSAHDESWAGLGGILLLRGEFGSQGMASPLTEPLVPGKKYYVEFQVQNRGIEHQDPSLLRTCQSDPPKSLFLHTSTDSIYITPFPTGGFEYSSQIIGQVLDERIADNKASSWFKVATCFEAQDAATHFGISTITGDFNIDPPCELDDSPLPLYFHWFFYFFDNFVLEQMPDQLQETRVFCEEEGGIEIDVIEMLGPYQEIQGASVQWSDGSSDNPRFFENPGSYSAEIILPCGTIPVEVNLESIICEPKVYVPNAFHPDFDGINDQLQPFIAVDAPIRKYRFIVFDRWGNEVFRAEEPNKGWDGTSRGKPAPVASYTWILQFEVDRLNIIEPYTLQR